MLSTRTALGLAATTAGLALVAGCGSSSSSTGGTAAAAVVPTPPVCTLVSGILSNGPDSDADPVGYAQAQIGPIASVKTTNQALASALAALDTAFKNEYAANASKASKAAVAKAQAKVNAECPGAAS